VNELFPGAERPETLAATPCDVALSDLRKICDNAPSKICWMDSVPPVSKIRIGAKFAPSWLPYST